MKKVFLDYDQAGLDAQYEQRTFVPHADAIIQRYVTASDAVRQRLGMPVWRDHLFAYMARNARSATAYFQLPSTQVVEMGSQIEI